MESSKKTDLPTLLYIYIAGRVQNGQTGQNKTFLNQSILKLNVKRLQGCKDVKIVLHKMNSFISEHIFPPALNLE